MMVFPKSLKNNVCPAFYVNDTRIVFERRNYTLDMWYEMICVMMHLLTSLYEEYMQEEI